MGEIRLQINELLGINSLADDAIAERLKQSTEQAATYYQKLFEERESISQNPDAPPFRHRLRVSKNEIRAAVDGMDASTLAWAAGRELLHGSFAKPESSLQLLETLSTRAPVATADSLLGTLIDLEREVIVGHTIIDSDGVEKYEKWQTEKQAATDVLIKNKSLVARSIELIAQATTKPQLALSFLRDERNTPLEIAYREAPELRVAVQAAVEKLEARVSEQ